MYQSVRWSINFALIAGSRTALLHFLWALKLCCPYFIHYRWVFIGCLGRRCLLQVGSFAAHSAYGSWLRPLFTSLFSVVRRRRRRQHPGRALVACLERRRRARELAVRGRRRWTDRSRRGRVGGALWRRASSGTVCGHVGQLLEERLQRCKTPVR